MNPSLIALSFLFAFIASSAQAQFLSDANDFFLCNGCTYHILPSIGTCGGMTLSKTGNETCPLTVGPASCNVSEFNKGLPWKFSTPLKIVPIAGQIVDISSAGGDLPNCVPSPSIWTIVEGEDGTQSVKVGGYETTIKGGFVILPVGIYTYKIMFCPTDGGSCGDLGLSNGGLAITDHPTYFALVKVQSSEVAEN